MTPQATGKHLALLAGAAFVLLILGYSLYLLLRAGPVKLDAASLHGARVRWNARGVPNYDIDVEVFAPNRATARLKVRRGSISEMTYQRYTPDSTRRGDVWTVAGQLAILELELKQANDPHRFGAPKDAAIFQMVHFHSKYGYPISYRRRIEGIQNESHWETVRFRPVSP